MLVECALNGGLCKVGFVRWVFKVDFTRWGSAGVQNGEGIPVGNENQYPGGNVVPGEE